MNPTALTIAANGIELAGERHPKLGPPIPFSVVLAHHMRVHEAWQREMKKAMRSDLHEMHLRAHRKALPASEIG